ncbi:MAG TPA: LysM peptidoglycan-binding domain-containing protein [Longimicrobium sp.]|nr:LysM peptidoglycan-binding domain-containing protein [Longimicrobium sp.]
MKKAALAVAATLAAVAPLAAQQDTVPEGRVHTVRRGDTLWDLARQYLADPFLWPEIFRLNTDVVRDPARIYPNERLVLPPGVAAAGPRDTERTVFYQAGEREGPRDRLTILPAGSADFPVVRHGDFYRAGFVVPDAEVRPQGRVREIISPTVVPLSRQPTVQIYDKILVSTDSGMPAFRIGDRVQFIRAERLMQPYGRLFTPRGLGTVANVDGGTATVVVIRMFDPIGPGDLVMPAPAFPVPNNVRPAASADLQGRLVGFQREHTLQAVEELVVLDVGRQAGVKEGDVFEVFLPRQRANWGTRPEVHVGRMQVVKVTQRTATARITHLEQPAVAIGQPVRRVAKMP